VISRLPALKRQALWSAALVAILWALVPVRLPSLSSGPASAECFTASDAPPDPQRPELVPLLEHCTALHPTDVELLSDLGFMYESAGRGGDAEAVYRRALLVDPGYADLRIRLGRLLQKRGDVAGARREAEAALNLQPNRQAVLDLLYDTGGP
jgi:tetratricopeptide (TPR) repeat protein